MRVGGSVKDLVKALHHGHENEDSQRQSYKLPPSCFFDSRYKGELMVTVQSASSLVVLFIAIRSCKTFPRTLPNYYAFSLHALPARILLASYACPACLGRCDLNVTERPV